MTIERTKNEIIFRLPNNINLDDLQDFVDYFQYRTIAKKSKASQTEVDNLVKEIKKGRWDKTRKQLGLWELSLIRILLSVQFLTQTVK